MLRDFSTSSTFVDSTISPPYQLLNSHFDSSVRSTARMCHTPLSVFTCHPFACTILRTGLLILLATPPYCPYCCKALSEPRPRQRVFHGSPSLPPHLGHSNPPSSQLTFPTPITSSIGLLSPWLSMVSSGWGNTQLQRDSPLMPGPYLLVIFC